MEGVWLAGAGRVTGRCGMGGSGWATAARYDTDSGMSFFVKQASAGRIFRPAPPRRAPAEPVPCMDWRRPAEAAAAAAALHEISPHGSAKYDLGGCRAGERGG